MLVEHIILVLVIILALSLVAQPISKLLHLPLASVLVLIGFVLSELFVYAGVDTGIRAGNFQSIIFYVLLPVLIFESAYSIDKPCLKKNLFVILVLAIVTMLFTCFIVAALLFYGIGHAAGFPWIAALMTGAILAATDPVAVVAKLREMHAPKRVAILLEGESLFNDATAIVLFGLFLSIATSTSAVEIASDTAVLIKVSLDFSVIFFGGALTGIVVGLFTGYMQKRLKQDILTAVLSVLAAYGSFLLAEYFAVSGVMSTLLAGLSFSSLVHSDKDFSNKASGVNNRHLWDVLSHIANVSVFLIVGAVIGVAMFEQRWLAMLIAILCLVIARAISVYGVLMFFSFFEKLKVPLPLQTVMVWGGLRGAVTLALALSLPTSLDYWWTIQSIAFGVVVFSLFVQAPTMRLLLKRLSL